MIECPDLEADWWVDEDTYPWDCDLFYELDVDFEDDAD